MEFECIFGHSIDVDGEEWIDLKPLVPDTVTQSSICHDTARKFVDDHVLVQEEQLDSEVEVTTNAQSISKPAGEITSGFEQHKDIQMEKKKKTTTEEAAEPSVPSSAKTSAPVSEATKSKEALVAFYLGRAKTMEAKHKMITTTTD